MRFYLTWYFPNAINYWNPERDDEGEIIPDRGWKNYYAAVFDNAHEVARYCIENHDRLYQQSMLFKDALYSSTLPEKALEAVGANISILKSPTCLRLEDGSFYGFEGCHADEGSCEGSCTHVWNYAQALPFLFPSLERSMRALDFKYNMDKDGGMMFRLQLPPGRERMNFRPCVDGHFGGVLKVYRDWKISGDTAWLEGIWPYIKRCIEYAWSPENRDCWDPDKKGIIEGRQHHTLDMELFGPNSWLSGFYIAALKAGVLTGYEALVEEPPFDDDWYMLMYGPYTGDNPHFTNDSFGGHDRFDRPGVVRSDDDNHIDVFNQHILEDNGPNVSSKNLMDEWVYHKVRDWGGGGRATELFAAKRCCRLL